MRAQLQHNKAGLIEFYVPEGLPDGAGDVYVYTSGTALLDSSNLNGSSNATRDAANTTFQVAADIGDSSITVADTTNFVLGNSYVVVNEDGRKQSVQVVAKAAASLLLDEPLEFDCAANDSRIRANRLYVNLTTTHTATRRRRLRALWEYAVGGVTYQHSTFFDVVALPFDLQLNERFIEDIYPAFGEAAGALNLGRKLMRGAERDIWTFLEGQGIYPDLVRDTSILQMAAAYRVLERLMRVDDPTRTEYGELYAEALDRFLRSKAWFDSDDDLTVASGGSVVTYGDDEAYAVGDGELLGETVSSEFGTPAVYMKVG